MSTVLPTTGPVPCPATARAAALLPIYNRALQTTTAILGGLAALLLGFHAYGLSQWATRPADLDRAPDLVHLVDLNRADRTELLQLPGVGSGLAARIEAYRREQGGFRHVHDLLQVKGVGPATFERLRPWIRVADAGEEVDRKTSPVRKSARPIRLVAELHDGPAAVSNKAGKPLLESPLDINRASAAELIRLPGIGAKRAQMILEERERGAFKSVADLRRVHGIGVKTLEKLRPFIKAEPVSRQVASDSNRFNE